MLMSTRKIFSLLMVLLLFCGTALWAQPTPGAERPHNVIFFISDGAGPASFTMGRDYRRIVGDGQELAIDGMQVGSAHTYATDSRVTDSAAGATAFSAGVKTYNGAIAVDTLEQPVATLLEAAERRGMATGLVATSTITHATPAAFSAHVSSRGEEGEIAAQQIEQGIEVMFGGGRRFFLPEAEGGARNDGRNLIEEVRSKGGHIISTRDELNQTRATPVLGLFSMSHMAYEIDRDARTEPGLAEMTACAIDLLKDDPDGFFLMVEGSRIDHAQHGNDAAAAVREVLAFDEAIRVALDFARKDARTLVVSVSDHETGGLSLGRNIDGKGLYTWHPEVLAGVRASLGTITDAVARDSRHPFQTLGEYTGLDDLSSEEKAMVQEALTDKARLNAAIGEIISRRAVVGWTTGGHTAVDVNLYAFGPGSERLVGHHDNSWVGGAVADLLGFDLPALTEALRQTVGSH